MLPTPPEGLRHWRPDDAPVLAAAWVDPTITRWNQPPDGLDAATWIAGTEVRWARRLALDLVIVAPDELADRRVRVGGDRERADPPAGEVGLATFSSGPARAELGVWIAGGHRRNGLATAAVRTVARWALDPDGLGLDQLWARTDPSNVAAQALFERVGWDRLGSSGGMSIWSATGPVLR